MNSICWHIKRLRKTFEPKRTKGKTNKQKKNLIPIMGIISDEFSNDLIFNTVNYVKHGEPVNNAYPIC